MYFYVCFISNTLKNSKQEKLLRVSVDNKLDFATHLLNITKNAYIKFNALTRVQKNTWLQIKKTYILFLY